MLLAVALIDGCDSLGDEPELITVPDFSIEIVGGNPVVDEDNSVVITVRAEGPGGLEDLEVVIVQQAQNGTIVVVPSNLPRVASGQKPMAPQAIPDQVVFDRFVAQRS